MRSGRAKYMITSNVKRLDDWIERTRKPKSKRTIRRASKKKDGK